MYNVQIKIIKSFREDGAILQNDNCQQWREVESRKMEGKIIGGRYECRRDLGKGGNGRVFLCFDTKLQKEWAVKELYEWEEIGLNEKDECYSDKLDKEPSQMAEAELLKTISCNLFPRIVDVVYETDKTYLVMDYVEGVTLKEKMQRQKLTEKDVLPWAVEIAKALQYLHHMSPQILYMDCKPENIIITPQGEIRLVDLGSVYICGCEKKQRISGTRFFSPLQWQEPDVRSDIYAFGMTLYYLLAGEKKIFRRKGRLSIRDANPSVSEGMNAIIARCTENDTSKRLQSMDEVIYHLEHIKEIDRQERLKKQTGTSIALIAKCICAAGILTGAWICVENNELSMIWWMIFAAVMFCVLCRKQNFTLYEIKKEIFCGGGKRILLFLLVILGALRIMTVSVQAETPLKRYYEKTTHKNLESEKITEGNQRVERHRLQVTLYDHQGRKLLLKKDAVWKVSEDILLSVPLEELEKTEGKITVLYEDTDTGTVKRYEFSCCRK